MKFLFPLFLILFVYSCVEETKVNDQQIEKRLLSGEFEAYSHLPSVPCDSLFQDSTGMYYRYDSLFTGECYLNYPNMDSRYEIRQIFKGKLHGNRILLSPKGDTLNRNIYNHGELVRKSVGKEEQIHCDSLVLKLMPNGKEVVEYLGNPFTGKCVRYFPAPDTNQIYLQIPYKQGKIHGTMIFYSKQGKEILTEDYREGEKL
ncbi:MAG: hypothetical protein R3277_06440 [Brumimicrobium sp.]|nr:hypothetical protein [Brumimicrobium sp.]